MPRLIPRLLRNLEHTRRLPSRVLRERPQQPPVSEVTHGRVFTRSKHVDITPTGRSESILLERDTLRLIYRHTRWQRQKSLAPEVRVSRAKWEAKQKRGRAPPDAVPREMTEEERTLWANPYLRMLGSPLRRCFETNWTLPRDLLIRMSPVLIPGDNRNTVFLPAGLEHPSIRRFRGGKCHYLLCWKHTLEHVQNKGTYKRWSPESYQISMHPLVVQQVSHSLRVRVLQELQILARQVCRPDNPSSPPLLRRLTRAEWNDIKSSGVIPIKNAIAILVVPPLNRDTSTNERPEPNASSVPTDEDLTPTRHASQPFPVSIMYRTNQNEGWPTVDDARLLPSAQVPLYHGVPLFPSRTQRAALHAALNQVLEVERTARSPIYRQAKLHAREDYCRARGDQKASHAVLVCSDERTLLRGDTVPLAIALWRLRMWEVGSDGVDKLIDWTISPSQT